MTEKCKRKELEASYEVALEILREIVSLYKEEDNNSRDDSVKEILEMHHLL